MHQICKAHAALTVMAALLALSGTANAELVVLKSEYRAGVLVVRGETTKPNQQVTLDGRYEEYSDRFGDFVFRVRYLPHDCVVQIRSGQTARPAVVANCEPVAPNPLDRGNQTSSTAKSISMRVVRATCEAGKECSVNCNADEHAINAACPSGAAQLRSERTVTCPSDADGQMVAYCLRPRE